MHFDWLSVLLALDLIYFPVIALWAAWQVLKIRRAERSQEYTDDDNKHLEQVLSKLNECIKSNDVRLTALEKKTEALYPEFLERINRLELQAHSGSIHSQAMKLLESGMTPDKLASVCGLSRDEAELLKALHEANNNRD